MVRPLLDPRLSELDPRLDESPFALYRRLREGERPILVDVREPGRGGLTLRGAVPWPGPGWQPPATRPVLLFDDDGQRARELARTLRAAGHGTVRALWGGLELYDFALDPHVLGEERHLAPRA